MKILKIIILIIFISIITYFGYRYFNLKNNINKEINNDCVFTEDLYSYKQCIFNYQTQLLEVLDNKYNEIIEKSEFYFIQKTDDNYIELNKERINKFKDSQKDWIEYKNKYCDFIAYDYYLGSGQDLYRVECKIDLIKKRIDELNKIK